MSEWQPISKLDDLMDGTVVLWNKRGFAVVANRVLAADVHKYSHFFPVSAITPPPQEARDE